MEMTYLDRSNYLRGLLLLTRQDNEVKKEEEEFVVTIGEKLGFSSDFCKRALDELLENDNIIEEAPHFSNDEVAIQFVKEGVKLALVDNDLDLSELEWINSVIKENELENDWRLNQIEYFNQSFEHIEDPNIMKMITN